MQVPETTFQIAQNLQRLAVELALAKDLVEVRKEELRKADQSLRSAVSNAEFAEAAIQKEVRALCGRARSPEFQQADKEARSLLAEMIKPFT